ncbi:zincin [Aspergillus sclerotiicarbonarius CBS 121057]|uniref:Zincin n=1 Tax=Aspergillus sclerotiicarbonarius (strain CBS 121057 / IBT 28362) TaxID=1448318 RepID=A0A319EF03_ASPSB|nr:zincin [Aspergillus sclerotiicarbonarius CBS 121057]
MCGNYPVADVNSLSNFHQVTTRHTELELTIDFEQAIVGGSTVTTLECITDISQIIFDTSYLVIKSAAVGTRPLQWELKSYSPPNGCPLHVHLDRRYRSGETLQLRIEFQTTTESTGLQWFSPSQTDDKKYPYTFSQCEPVHARAIFPCQDTPSVKTTFDIGVSSPLPVVASGVPEHSLLFHPVENYPEIKHYTFKQDIPISNYLFAVASGNMVGEQIGPKSYLYCTPGDMPACREELKPDLQKIMDAAEKLIFEYPWPLYNLVILPRSFHLGGMENPIFNFYSATVISGDRANINVVAHEFAHSFSGNLVTNASWEHFWLNEGWTVYIERFILREVRGETEETLRALVGWQELEYGIESYGGENSLDTTMVLNFRDKRPDDIMSTIVYEKGYTFLRHLETTVGRGKWLPFVPYYFAKFSQKSVDSTQFKNTVLEFFESDTDAFAKLTEVNWDMWYHKPGAIPKPDLRSTIYDDCQSLARKWAPESATSVLQPCATDVEGWSVCQVLVFLDELLQKPDLISLKLVNAMNLEYKWSKSTNLEVLTRYLRVALRAGDKRVLAQTEEVLGQTGRMKFVRPLLEGIMSIDGQLAVRVYQRYKAFYHPTCLRLIEGILENQGLL